MALTTVDDAKLFLGIDESDASEDARIAMFIDDAEAVFTAYCKRSFSREVYTEYYSGNGTRFIVLNNLPILQVLNVWVDNDGDFGQANDDDSDPFDSGTLQDAGTFALMLDKTLVGTAPAWDADETYEAGDLVVNSGSYFQAIAESLNQVPPNTTYWKAAAKNLVVGKSGIIERSNSNWPTMGSIYLPGNLAREAGQFLGNVKVQYAAGYPEGFVPRELAYACRLQVSLLRQTAAKGGRLQSESVTDYSWSIASQPGAGEAPEIGSIRQILNRYRSVPAIGSDIAALPANNAGGWR